ncbi:MAG: HlyD family efflux transporter periplasmic adaptor subunit [Candidatus Accumulibacter sp.]|jgi:multidrug efflux system membrane fusion protein|nr:HlyD family efflux transporter periplasmic adaptor subunit [Accumulibacter sp.]
MGSLRACGHRNDEGKERNEDRAEKIKNRSRILASAACIFFSAASAFAEDAPDALIGAALVAQGVSRPAYNAQLNFAMPGSVFSIQVKPGQAVKAGELLMSLDTRAEDSRLKLLEQEIRSSIKIRTLSTKIRQANLDMERYAAALQDKAATLMEAQHAKLAHDVSRLALEEEHFRIAQLKLNRDELLAIRERMRLYAPCDGYVEDVLVELGVAVDKNIPALQLVSIDPLQVDITLPVEQAMRIREGDRVRAVLPDGEERPAFIKQVARIAVLSNRSLKVRVDVPNPAGTPAGLMVKVFFPEGADRPPIKPEGAEHEPEAK